MEASLRWMIKDDYDAVCSIESFNSKERLTPNDLVSNLRPCNSVGLVLELDYNIYGYVIYVLNETSIVVTHLAIVKECRRKGFGTKIISKLKNKLSTSRRTHIDMLVDEYNLNAQLFLKANGFTAISIAKEEQISKYLFTYNILIENTVGDTYD